MLFKVSYVDKNDSEYICDMCNKRIRISEINKIKVEEHCKKTKKYWDLCDDCFEKLVKSINIYKRKHREK